MRGRQFAVTIEISYLGGRLSDGSLLALTRAFVDRQELVEHSRFSADHGTFTTVTLVARVRAQTPLAALTRIDGFLDHALRHSGLFEQFDVTGRSLRVDPTNRMTERG